jgi:Na+/H+-dicarboxylate symporter
MAKLEKLGCSKPLVGLVVPSGYTFNTNGTSIYMTLGQQMTIFGVAVLTSKGASGVQGASFIALVATLTVIPTIPVVGMALILGIDRFMSMFRALINMVGNGVATVVVAQKKKLIAKRWQKGSLESIPSAKAAQTVRRFLSLLRLRRAIELSCFMEVLPCLVSMPSRSTGNHFL